MKFDEKHGDDVDDPLCSTILELCKNFVQIWVQSSQKLR